MLSSTGILKREEIRSLLCFVATFFTMDSRYHKAARNVVFVAMVLVAMTLTGTHVEAVTHPGDIEALKEVLGFPLRSFSLSNFSKNLALFES